MPAHSPTSGNAPGLPAVLPRRSFLTALAPLGALAVASPAIARTMTREEQIAHHKAELADFALPDHPADNLPFIMPVASEPNMVALCIPEAKITHAFCYMLADGHTIHGEHGRCNDGSGWRKCLPGEWDGRIVGRVVTLLKRTGRSWSELGRSALDG